jgi:shikimate dehydrogenase
VRGKIYHLGLTGYPLGHSRSPDLHHAALAAAGLAGEYRLFPIHPEETEWKVAGLVDDLREGRLDGLNVTIPHKRIAMTCADRLSDVARDVGAVNTLSRGAGGQAVAGDNTDVPGFLLDVQKLVGKGSGSALVLGAGGSGRAVVYALSRAGWQVAILARRIEQAESLAKDLDDPHLQLQVGLLSQDTLASVSCDLLVNTTPLGMVPHPESCPWPEDLPLPRGAAVYDLVYNPQETVLLRRARANGHHAANGAGMLIAQAALAFQIWTGLEPPFEVMEQAFFTSDAMTFGRGEG